MMDENEIDQKIKSLKKLSKMSKTIKKTKHEAAKELKQHMLSDSFSQSSCLTLSGIGKANKIRSLCKIKNSRTFKQISDEADEKLSEIFSETLSKLASPQINIKKRSGSFTSTQDHFMQKQK